MSLQDHTIMQIIVVAGEQRTLKMKQAILADNETDALKEYLHLVLDPQHNFYMTLKGLPTPIEATTPCEHWDFTSMMELLRCMIARKIPAAALKTTIAQFLASAGPTLVTLFKLAIDRQLPGNIGEKIVNKAFPDLIYHQPYGGVKSYDGEKIHTRFDWNAGVMLQEKADGLALFVSKSYDAIIKVHTRQGQDVTDSMYPLIREAALNVDVGTVTQFEALLRDAKGKIIPRIKANGMFNSIFQGTKCAPGRVSLIAIDQIEYNGFYAGIDNTPCTNRFATLATFVYDYTERIGRNNPNYPTMRLPDHRTVFCVNDAKHTVGEWIAYGMEGGVLKDPLAPWKDTKMTSQMKLKNCFECSLRVVDWVPHSRNKEWVGSLIVESKYDHPDRRMIKTKVGSGLNEDPTSDRCRTAGPAPFLDKIIEVEAECITKYNALQHPRITGIRIDKNHADTYTEVLAAYEDSISIEED